MKKRITQMLLVISMLILLGSSATMVFAETIDFHNQIDYRKPSSAKSIVKKLKLSKKKHKHFKYYYTGNKVQIGINDKDYYFPDLYPYLSVINNGNKKLTFHGIKIGDTKAKVKEKLEKTAYGRYLKKDMSYAGFGPDGIYMKFKNGKLKSWKYYLEPTG